MVAFVVAFARAAIRRPELIALAPDVNQRRRRMGKALEMDRVAPVLDFIKQDINQGNGATGWVDRAKVAGFSDEDISEAVEWLGRARQYLDGA
jgi:hypothetical protein